MNVILTSGISALILIGIITFLFTKLKDVSWYTASIYMFLVGFWIIMTFVRKVMTYDTKTEVLPFWAWPVVLASFQFVQVITRIPIGKLSGKIKSRQMPLILATSFILIPAVLMIASNFALYSLILAVVFTGVFGASFGLQNQYWSENYKMNSAFITVAMISLLPTLGALSSTFIVEVIKYLHDGNGEVSNNILRWTLLGFAISLAVLIVTYWIFPERKETIKLDNVNVFSKKIKTLKIKDILNMSIVVVFVSFSYNLVTMGASSQDVIIAQKDMDTMYMTIVSIVVALMVAIWLIRIIPAYILTIIGQALLLFGFIFGMGVTFGGSNSSALKIVYLLIITIGFTIYQNTLVGSMLQFDHKNSALVLGIWLTIRSAATGFGRMTNGIIMQYDPSDVKWLLLAATMIISFSIPYSIFKYSRANKLIFNMVTKTEKTLKNKLWSSSKVVAK